MSEIRQNIPLLADLQGRIEAISLFDVLQFLDASRQRGRLTVETTQPVGWLEFANGYVGEAHAGSLSGIDAALALLSTRAGTFRFDGSDDAVGDEVALGTLLMEAVRLEDERERRIELVPAPATPLVLRFADKAPEDVWGCQLAAVVAQLAKGRISRAKLEAELPIAPIKIQLALAILVDAGLLGEGPPSSSVNYRLASEGGALEMALSCRFSSGLRLVIGCPPNVSSLEIEAAVAALAVAVRATPPVRSRISLDGPSFLRLHPGRGGFLSLTFLPMVRKNRFLLQTFVSSVDVALFSLAAPPDEIGAWQSACASNPTLLRGAIPKKDLTATCLVEALLDTLTQSTPLS
jgi:hypothetical protein